MRVLILSALSLVFTVIAHAEMGGDHSQEVQKGNRPEADARAESKSKAIAASDGLAEGTRFYRTSGGRRHNGVLESSCSSTSEIRIGRCEIRVPTLLGIPPPSFTVGRVSYLRTTRLFVQYGWGPKRTYLKNVSRVEIQMAEGHGGRFLCDIDGWSSRYLDAQEIRCVLSPLYSLTPSQ